MAGNIPKDVMEQLIQAGVKFDEDGNIIDDDNEFIALSDDNDDVDDDEDLNQTDDQDDEDVSFEDDEDDGESGEDDQDEDDDEEDEPVHPKKRKKVSKDSDEDTSEKPLLTPREVTPPKTEDTNPDLTELKKNIQALLEQYQNNSNNTNDDVDVNDDISATLAELRREAQEFRQLRAQTFADNVKKRVNENDYGADFSTIVQSKQWDEYLSSRAYGKKIADLYKQSILEHDADAVIFFFDDFASKYLKSSAKEEQSVKQDDLDDLAVPDKTKANKAPKKRSKYDFEEEDYIRKLDEAERGRISREEFLAFEKKFELALSKGRVKPSR